MIIDQYFYLNQQRETNEVILGCPKSCESPTFRTSSYLRKLEMEHDGINSFFRTSSLFLNYDNIDAFFTNALFECLNFIRLFIFLIHPKSAFSNGGRGAINKLKAMYVVVTNFLL